MTFSKSRCFLKTDFCLEWSLFRETYDKKGQTYKLENIFILVVKFSCKDGEFAQYQRV